MKVNQPLVRLVGSVCAAALVVWVALSLFNSYRVHFPNREHSMIPPLNDMQTFCVGRYLIDLPRGSVLHRALSSAGGAASVEFFTEQPVPHYRFESTVQDRWVALQKLTVDDLGKPFIQPSEKIELPPDGVIFTFNHHSTYLKEWPDGTTGTQFFYDTEGYLWRNGILYRFKDAASKDEVINAMQRLQPRANTDIPSAQGFCAGQAFFPGPPEDGESTDFAFDLPTNPPVEFRIGTMAGARKKQDLASYNSVDFKARFIRNARQRIGDIEGEEWIHMSTSKEAGAIYSSELAAYWQHPEGNSYSRQPSVNANMTISVDEKIAPPAFGDFPPKKVDGDIGKEEFLALWDGVLKTLRPRPGAF